MDCRQYLAILTALPISVLYSNHHNNDHQDPSGHDRPAHVSDLLCTFAIALPLIAAITTQILFVDSIPSPRFLRSNAHQEDPRPRNPDRQHPPRNNPDHPWNPSTDRNNARHRSRGNHPNEWLTSTLILLLLIYETILATLATVYLHPPSGLTSTNPASQSSIRKSAGVILIVPIGVLAWQLVYIFFCTSSSTSRRRLQGFVYRNPNSAGHDDVGDDPENADGDAGEPARTGERYRDEDENQDENREVENESGRNSVVAEVARLNHDSKLASYIEQSRKRQHSYRT